MQHAKAGDIYKCAGRYVRIVQVRNGGTAKGSHGFVVEEGKYALLIECTKSGRPRRGAVKFKSMLRTVEGARIGNPEFIMAPAYEFVTNKRGTPATEKTMPKKTTKKTTKKSTRTRKSSSKKAAAKKTTKNAAAKKGRRKLSFRFKEGHKVPANLKLRKEDGDAAFNYKGETHYASSLSGFTAAQLRKLYELVTGHKTPASTKNVSYLKRRVRNRMQEWVGVR